MRDVPFTTSFTGAEAAACGWTRSALRHAERIGRIERLRRDVFVPAGLTDSARGLAVARSFDGAVVSHRSALLAHGLPLVGAAPDRVEVTVAPRANANLLGVDVHRAGLRQEDLALGGGATAVARTVIDVARHHGPFVSVAAIDAALQRQLTTPALVEDVLEYCTGWTYVRRARAAWSLADGRAESPLESISRLRFRQLDLPSPEPQKVILDEWGREVGRVDFYWDEFGVVGEADGKGKYLAADGRWDTEARWKEKVREESLRSLGLEVVRWNWGHAWRRPDILRQLVARALKMGRARQLAGLPRLWSLLDAA